MAQALRTTEDAGRDRPFDTLVTTVDLLLTRAAGGLVQNRPAATVEQLRSLGRMERMNPETIYLRGLAYPRCWQSRFSRLD
jgi:hypothetical protein